MDESVYGIWCVELGCFLSQDGEIFFQGIEQRNKRIEIAKQQYYLQDKTLKIIEFVFLGEVKCINHKLLD